MGFISMCPGFIKKQQHPFQVLPGEKLLVEWRHHDAKFSYIIISNLFFFFFQVACLI